MCMIYNIKVTNKMTKHFVYIIIFKKNKFLNICII